MPTLTERTANVIERIRGFNPYVVDSLLALGFTGGALWTVVIRVGGDDTYRSDSFLGVALLLLQTLPIAARTAAPLRALTVSMVAISLHIAVGYEGITFGTLAGLLILYSAASLTDTRGAILAALMTFAGITIFFATDRGDPGVTAALTTYMTYAAGWGIGIYSRSRREYTDVVEEHSRLLERERDVRAREAVAEERATIARELHDVVGHALNLVVIQAGGAQRVLESKPEAARESLASIETAARQALTDMERMLGILRAADESEDTLSPQPGLDQVENLAAQVSDAGLPVKVTVDGEQPALPSSIDLSAYRIIQEALTNSLKHAGQAHAQVAIHYSPESLDLEITDDGHGGSQPAKGNGGGRGLIGMKERVALYGGELSVGPRPEGGFRVHARLPLASDPE